MILSKPLVLFFTDAGPSNLMNALLLKNPSISYILYSKKNTPALSIFNTKNIILLDEDQAIEHIFLAN